MSPLLRRRLGLLLRCAMLCLVLQAPTGSEAQDTRDLKRPVSVADIIGMTQTGDRSYLDVFTRTGNVGLFSPDGTKFAFVTQKGNLKTDTVDFSLLVFRTADAFTSHRHEVVAVLSSSSNREAISHVTWLHDNETLVFLGEQPGQVPQLYEANSTTRKLKQLTHHPTPVVAYSMSDQGGSFVYAAELASQPVVSGEMRQRGYFITSQRWDDLYTEHAANAVSRKQLFVKNGAMGVPRSVGNPLELGASDEITLKTSPDGRYALLDAYITNPPVLWSEYEVASKGEISTTSCSSVLSYACPQQYLVVDLENQTIEPLVNAPLMPGSPGAVELFAWTRQNSVLLVNALLPLDITDPNERSKRLNHFYTAEITLPDHNIVKINEQTVPFSASEIRLDTERNSFVVQPHNATYGPPTEFHKEITDWKTTKVNSVAEKAGRLFVSLEQSLNAPPRLVASNPETKQQAVLLDLNPQFVHLTLGHVEIFRWKTHDAREAEGALYFPPDYVTGKSYPLIIQTHGHTRERFWVDGPFTTAFAAQPLANRGFLVLQMGLGDRYNKASLDEVAAVLGTPQEGPYSVAFLDAAVDELDRRKLIDRSRIGLTGFSRTAYHVLYALIHSKYRIAAAVVADGVNFGYAGCLYYMADAASSLCEKMNGGGPPYGASLSGWGQAAPTFNLDKIETPILLQAITAPLAEWEILAGLRWLKKPVEMLNFYPEGDHILVRPWQRMISQQAVVDWYSFWLKGEEDPDAAKAAQYARWRRMQEQRDKRMSRAGAN